MKSDTLSGKMTSAKKKKPNKKLKGIACVSQAPNTHSAPIKLCEFSQVLDPTPALVKG